jgi:hypothetical protein
MINGTKVMQKKRNITKKSRIIVSIANSQIVQGKKKRESKFSNIVTADKIK